MGNGLVRTRRRPKGNPVTDPTIQPDDGYDFAAEQRFSMRFTVVDYVPARPGWRTIFVNEQGIGITTRDVAAWLVEELEPYNESTGFAVDLPSDRPKISHHPTRRLVAGIADVVGIRPAHEKKGYIATIGPTDPEPSMEDIVGLCLSWQKTWAKEATEEAAVPPPSDDEIAARLARLGPGAIHELLEEFRITRRFGLDPNAAEP
jgi:hypothetical protein